MSELKSLLFTTEFFAAFGDKKLTAADRAAILKALALLDANERHPVTPHPRPPGESAGNVVGLRESITAGGLHAPTRWEEAGRLV